MKRAALIGLLFALFGARGTAWAQPQISYITPDAGAPGMCVAVEIIAPSGTTGDFGNSDEMYPPEQIVRLTRASDSALVRLGPAAVSWNGRLIQQMFLLQPNTKVRDTEIYFDVVVSGISSAVDSFEIVTPYHFGVVTGGGAIPGPRTKRNTLVVDSVFLANGTYTVSTADPDGSTPGNQAYLPFRILSAGPIRLINANINANGSAGTTGTGGGAGGPGGGGGGSGYPGSGGAGYTGGGGQGGSSGGIGGVGTGSTSGANSYDGGMSLNALAGGDGNPGVGSADEGGGAGTGHPFGTSGVDGFGNAPSAPGGYGAGSGGGEAGTSPGAATYGGGGGGNATAGSAGGGVGNNAGQVVGNSMLLPFAGGSGGGSGNVMHVTSGVDGGSGGGGGGAIELTSFAEIAISNSTIHANGGNGSSGNTGFLQTAAGGGGGAGGAVSIGARDSIDINSTSAVAENGGSGGGGSNTGGNGGIGRARINGMVSTAVSMSSTNYFSTSKDFTGPSIQRVTSTPDSVFVHGYGESWDGVPASPLSIVVNYSWPSSHVWAWVIAVPKFDPKSHTYQWDAAFSNSKNAVDTEVFVVAVQNEPVISGTRTDVPSGVMSHTSGIISPVLGAPKMLVKVTRIDFGTIVVDSCSADTTIEIYSTGRSNLIIDSAAFTPSIPDYHLKTILPDTLAPGDSMKLTLSFCPTTAQCPIAGVLTIYSNASDTNVDLTGCGVQPHIIVDPLVLNFGRVHIGDCKDTFATVIDTGTSQLVISKESLGDDAHFKVLDPLPIIIPAHDTATIHLEFCPSDTTSISTIDTLVSDAPESPSLLTLLGSGKIGALSMPATLDFGLIHLGECKDSGFYIVNTGNDSLLVTSAIIPPSNFTLLSPRVPFVLGAGDSVYDSIEFCATDTGTSTSYNTVGADVPDSQTTLLFAHVGIGILSIPDTINFGSVPSGSCVDTNIWVKNIGTDTLFLSVPAIVPPFHYFGPTPLVLAPGTGDSVAFRFCPTDTNTHQETTDFDTIRAGISPPFTLLGKGTEGILSASPAAIDLGCIAQGQSATITDTIRNTGMAELDSLSVSMNPSSMGSFVHLPPEALLPGAEDSVVLTIPASNYGPLSGTLIFAWHGGAPVTLPITGNVTTPPAIVALNALATFDTTLIGDSSVTKCLQITNYSCIPISADSTLILGALPGEFEILSNSTPSLLYDSTIGTICIRYRPQRIGLDTASLVIVNGKDTITVGTLAGVGKGNAVGIRLAVDTVAGQPGEIVNVPVRALDTLTSASITSLTFRITFDPMQLDLKKPVAPITFSIAPATALSTTATYSVTSNSIGDKEITASYSSPLVGTPIVAELPFEILEPTSNTAAIHLVGATFGASPASLSSSTDGEVQIEQCDTNNRAALGIAPITVSPNNPNPFNARTTITVNVHLAGHLTVEVYNALGRKTLVPYNGDVGIGTVTVPVDASILPSGAYRYITTWTGTGAPYQPQSARDEKTMIVLGQ